LYDINKENNEILTFVVILANNNKAYIIVCRVDENPERFSLAIEHHTPIITIISTT